MPLTEVSGRLSDLIPRRAGLRVDRSRPGELYGVQRARVDNDTALNEGLTMLGVSLPAHRDPQAMRVGKLHHLHYVIRRARLEHGGWEPLDCPAGIYRHRLARGIIEQQDAVQFR